MRPYILVVILALLFCSCKEKSLDPNGGYTVSGIILSRGSPVPAANVTLNNRSDLSSQTAPNGKFTIFNVPIGNYALSAEKSNTDGSFLATTSYVTVAGDVTLDPLILPRGVTMYTVENPEATSLKVSWNPTDAADFREYKLYRNTTSGLDENTGTLAHVSTTISDTQFIDSNLNAMTQYFYRVYVMNDYGRLGGSDIASSSTSNVDLATNGSFENVTAPAIIPDGWNAWGTSGKFSSDNSIAYSGSKSLRIQLSLSDWGVNSWGAYQQISPTKFEAVKNYKISFWFKADTLEQYESISCCFSKNNFFDGNQVLASLYNFVEGPRPAGTWQYYSFSLTIPSDVPTNYFVIFELVRAGTMGYNFHLPMTAWVDDVEIKKLP